jgi:hypothetical protein
MQSRQGAKEEESKENLGSGEPAADWEALRRNLLTNRTW